MRTLCSLKRSCGVLAVALGLSLFLSTPALAVHRRRPPVPQFRSTAEVTAATSDGAIPLWQGVVAVALVTSLAGLIVLILSRRYRSLLDRRDETIRTLRDEIDDWIGRLNHTEKRLDQAEKQGKRFASDREVLQNDNFQLNETLQKREQMLAEIRALDPEIDHKVQQAIETRKRTQEEEEARLARIAKQQEVRAQGKEKLDALLTQMKRGY